MKSSFISLRPVWIPLIVPSRCLHKSHGSFTILDSGTHHICPTCLNALFVTFAQEEEAISSSIACDAVYWIQRIEMDTRANSSLYQRYAVMLKKHFCFHSRSAKAILLSFEWMTEVKRHLATRSHETESPPPSIFLFPNGPQRFQWSDMISADPPVFYTVYFIYNGYLLSVFLVFSVALLNITSSDVFSVFY